MLSSSPDGDGEPSAAHSLVTLADPVLQVGGATTVSLQVMDGDGDDVTDGGLTVTFTLSGGSSLASFGSTVDNGDGTYAASVTATAAGTPVTIGATMAGQPVTTTLPTLQVVLPPPPEVSLSQSVVTVSNDSVDVGGSVAVTLRVRDATGADITTVGLTVAFSRTGGTSQGTFGATADNGNGTYQANFTGTSAGSPTSLRATINGSLVTSTSPTVQVFPAPSSGGASPAHSVVTVSSGAVQIGGTATAMLQARDAQSNNITTGGLTVVFGTLGGSSLGSFGPTTDNNNGTYTSTFTGTHAGTPATVVATMNGEQVSTQLPTVQVLSPPPGGVVCEAISPARCWYVAANAGTGGNGTFESPYRMPRDAVSQADPGDFIYLRGGTEFTHAHSNGSEWIIDTFGASAGAAGQLITVKSYPGEQAVIRGQVGSNGIPTENLSVRVSRSYWRIEGLRLIHSQICIACQFISGVHDVWIVGNHLSDTRGFWSNYGMITVHGDQLVDPGHPRNIFIHNNVVHTMWGMMPDGSGPYPWNTDPDVEHHACLLLQNTSGLVEVIGNEFYECPSAFYAKYLAPGPTIVRGNYVHNTQRIAAAWRSANATFENNVFARFTRDNGGFRLFSSATSMVWRNNTFDFAPWSMNSGGSGGAVDWDEGAGQVFRRNVILAGEYHGSVSGNFGSYDIDENCVIWSGSLVAAPGYSWTSYQSTFGHDPSGVRVQETSPASVFTNPAGGNYTLIGAAASACAGAGASP